MQLKKLKQNNKILLKLSLILLIASCSVSEVSYYDVGMKHYEEGRYRTSIEYFSRALLSDPADPELYYFRASAKAKLEDNQEAIYDYTKAIKLKPQMKYFMKRGLTYLTMYEVKRAINDFDEAVKFDTTNAEIYFNRGYSYSVLDNYEKALSDYSQAIILDSSNAKIFVNRGDLFSREGRQELAIFDFTKAITLNPDDEIAYYNRAQEFVYMEKYEPAIKDYTKVIELNPSKVEYYFLRGEANSLLKQFSYAAEDYTGAILLEPNNGNAYYNRGICYAQLDLRDDACNDFNQAGELGFFEAYEIIKEYCRESEKEKK
jgi:tetratricopeptide (TPR) repeat protein